MSRFLDAGSTPATSTDAAPFRGGPGCMLVNHKLARTTDYRFDVATNYGSLRPCLGNAVIGGAPLKTHRSSRGCSYNNLGLGTRMKNEPQLFTQYPSIRAVPCSKKVPHRSDSARSFSTSLLGFVRMALVIRLTRWSARDANAGWPASQASADISANRSSPSISARAVPSV